MKLPSGNSIQADFVERVPMLISVRDAVEANAVAEFPFEIMDLKEPRSGPLGSCDPAVWHACYDQIPFGGDWSVALGESSQALQVAAEVPRGMRFAKAGTSQLDHAVALRRRWDQIRQRLEGSVRFVAVAYADHPIARSLPPEAILREAAGCGLETLLIDTYAKAGKGTLALLGVPRIKGLIDMARDLGIEVVIAGGITFDGAKQALLIGARRIGLRGGLCHGPRDGEIDPQIVADWTRRMQRQHSPAERN
jgi:uncharacterized protein (UPF0264 family)